MSGLVQAQVLGRNEVFGVSVKTQLVVAFFLIMALTCKIWIRAEATSVGYELASARKYAIELDMARRELELHRSVLLRPDRLKKAAEERVGLQDLNPNQAVKIDYVS